MLKSSKYIFTPILIFFATYTYFSNFLGAPGQDISFARKMFENESNTDFYGATATLLYGLIPNHSILWWQYLYLIQILFTTFGLFFIFENYPNSLPKKDFYILLFFCYIFINIGATQTRDGIMISLMIFSLGLCKKFGWSKRILLGSIVPYILIFLFRPWLAITFLPLFLYILKSRFQIKFWYRILLSLFLCFLPYFVENLFIKFNNIDQAFPQQTFMIHDLSSLYCLSSDDSARQDAKNALLLLKNSGTSKEIEFLCLAFKPNSWGYSVSGNYPSNLGLEEPSVPVIEPIKPNDETKLTKFQTHWFNTIISNSTDYLQIKLFHFSQVLIGGESLVVDFNFTDLLSFGSELYNFPWKLMVFLHLFSPFFLIIFYLIFKNYIKRYVNHSINNILFLIFLFWIAITTIGFISDNGRYTYLPAILIYLYWLVQYTRFKQNLD